MSRTIRLGISLLDEGLHPVKTVPVCVMNWNEEAVKEAQEKFDLDLREEAHVVLVTEVVRNLHKVLPKLLFVDALDKGNEEIFQNTVRGGEPDQRVGEFLDRQGIRVVCDETTNTPEDVKANFLKGRVEVATRSVVTDSAGFPMAVFHGHYNQEPFVMVEVGAARDYLFHPRAARKIAEALNQRADVVDAEELEKAGCPGFKLGSQVKHLRVHQEEVGEVRRLYHGECDVKWADGHLSCEPFEDLTLM